MADPIVGIDLGTTNSLVAICDAAGPRVIPDAAGRPLVPSVVRYERDADGRPHAVVGFDARDRAVEFPRATMSSIKRLMGRSRRDAQAELAYLSFEVVEGENDTARARVPLVGEGVEIEGAALTLSPQEVSAAILAALRDQAAAALGVPVKRAVITVPAYFDDTQRQATRDAGRMAGLDVVRIVNEPTAAALAYGLGAGLSSADARERRIAVYDLGGGTFDISILKLTPGESASEPAFFQVLATAGDTHLGGDDLDHALINLFLEEMSGAAGGDRITLGTLPPASRRAIAEFARSVKHRLTSAPTAEVRIDLGGGRRYERSVSREELEGLALPLVERTLAACARAMRDAAARLEPEGLDAVILVGGMTRMPLVRERVGAFFGLPPYTGLDPDQVVALGAAVQASVLAGDRRDALLLDVIPLSLGVETIGGAAAKLIMRNSTVPARATEMFSTSVDNQTAIRLNVVQGEREMAADCRSLGVFSLAVPPMPAGMPQVQVEFLVDANGVLTVNALERRSGRRAGVQIVPNHGLTRDEVDRIERESILHARDDMERHRIIDLISNSRLDLKWIADRLERFADRLEAADRDELTTRFSTLRAMVEAADADWRAVQAGAFHAAKLALDRASLRLQEIAITESLRSEGR